MKWLPLLPCLLLAACSKPSFTQEQLMDPNACMKCHPDHVAQWASSMHAYAADDPIFRAMNARGQRETNGTLGTFCVNCHAPLAVRMGATTDGLNLDSVPAQLKGVTCYFCHSVDEVKDDHNNPLQLATDNVLRGGITNPVGNTAHYARYSPIHDRQRPESATLCGSCHDIVNPLGTLIERTFHEWQGTVYNSTNPEQLQTCGKCHMSGHQGLAAQAPGVLVRTVHDHSFAALDVALTPFPGMDTQRAAIDDALTTAIGARLCVTQDQSDPSRSEISLSLDNVAVGHGWPSGSSQDRRAWVELVASRGGQVIFQTGVVPDGQAVTDTKESDPNLWLLRDTMTDASGMETHNFWDAAADAGDQLPPSVTNDPNDPRYFHAVQKLFTITGMPDHVTAKVHIRPVGLDVIQDLVSTGDLDASVAQTMPTFTLSGTVLDWKPGASCVP